MKKIWIATILLTCLLVTAPTKQSHAIVWVVVQKALIAAIKAADLAIQRLQNKTIWLQNAQKQLENTMSKIKLDEITGWAEKQKKLYADYYEELKKVKSIITYYQRIRSITEKQIKLVEAYKRAYGLFKQDKNFTPGEIAYMEKVYTGLINESLKSVDEIMLVINSFKTQMTDAQRIIIINRAADRIDQHYADLQQFNTQNQMLSLSRAKTLHEIQLVKALNGL